MPGAAGSDPTVGYNVCATGLDAAKQLPWVLYHELPRADGP